MPITLPSTLQPPIVFFWLNGTNDLSTVHWCKTNVYSFVFPYLLFYLQKLSKFLHCEVIFLVTVAQQQQVEVTSQWHHLVKHRELFKGQGSLVLVSVGLLKNKHNQCTCSVKELEDRIFTVGKDNLERILAPFRAMSNHGLCYTSHKPWFGLPLVQLVNDGLEQLICFKWFLSTSLSSVTSVFYCAEPLRAEQWLLTTVCNFSQKISPKITYLTQKLPSVPNCG